MVWMKYLSDIFICSFYDFSVSTLYNVNNDYLIWYFIQNLYFPTLETYLGHAIIHPVIKYTFIIYRK